MNKLVLITTVLFLVSGILVVGIYSDLLFETEFVNDFYDVENTRAYDLINQDKQLPLSKEGGGK